MTYKQLIKELEGYNIEKEAIYLLITERLKITNWELKLKFNEEVEAILYSDLEKLKQNIPVQYILGYTYFYKSKFIVNPDVLIPRFDTEVVVETALEEIKKFNNPKVLDLCTGSGCIAISLKKEMPLLNIIASDISYKAIKVAKRNCELNNVNMEIKQSDLLSNIKDCFDIIVSNPPYIDINEDIMSLVKDNEPSLALYSPNNGLYHYEEIMKQANLSKDGIIIFEIPSNRDPEIILLVNKYFESYKIIKDYNNLSRVIILSQRRVI